MQRALLIVVMALCWAVSLAVAMDDPPCGVAPGDTCSTDTQCECMHGGDE